MSQNPARFSSGMEPTLRKNFGKPIQIPKPKTPTENGNRKQEPKLINVYCLNCESFVRVAESDGDINQTPEELEQNLDPWEFCSDECEDTWTNFWSLIYCVWEDEDKEPKPNQKPD